MTLTSQNALAFVEQHGVVLESAVGPVSNLAEAIAGQSIRGSWWGHAQGHEIFAATRAVRASKDILVCRLVERKITYVHRRLWPALVRLAHRIDRHRLAAIQELHTASGAHRVETIPYPDWVPPEVQQLATRLTEERAIQDVGEGCKLWLA
jgi:hypothetical protein